MAIDMQRGYAKGRATRAEILAVATQVFAQVGYNGASLREIAARCGITHPGLIHHFPTKAALLAAVLEQRDIDDAKRFAPDAGRPQGIVDRMVDLVGYNQTQPHMVELHTALSAEATAPSHPAHDYFVARYRRLRQEIAKAVRASQAAGTIRDDIDPDATAAALGALMDGLQVQWLLDPESVDMAQAFAAVVRRMLRPVASMHEDAPEVAHDVGDGS